MSVQVDPLWPMYFTMGLRHPTQHNGANGHPTQYNGAEAWLSSAQQMCRGAKHFSSSFEPTLPTANKRWVG